MLAIPMVRKNTVIDDQLYPGDILAGCENILSGGIATVGAGTWTGAAIATGIINRTGPTGGYTDTTDTAANIIAALQGNSPALAAVPGTSFRLLFINTVAFAMTFAAGVGVVAGTGTLSLGASAVRLYLLTILNSMVPVTVNATFLTTSKVVTFMLPGVTVALSEGPASAYNQISVGATVTGTNIATGTKVLGVTSGQGGIIGITLDTNTTGASASGGTAITIGPTVQIDTLFSASL